jgi:integrase
VPDAKSYLADRGRLADDPHDPTASRLWVSDSKTDTGIRHVEVTPKLRDILLAHRAQKIHCGYPTEPDRPFFCTSKGTRWDEDSIRERVLDAAARLASKKLIDHGLPPLPHVTPHTMRRIYVSVMLLATKFDIPFVQSQVGHTDSKLTMDVYARLLDRSKRAHGAAFDALLQDANTPSTVPRPANLAHKAILGRQRTFRRHQNLALALGKLRMGAAGFEPATSRV